MNIEDRIMLFVFNSRLKLYGSMQPTATATRLHYNVMSTVRTFNLYL